MISIVFEKYGILISFVNSALKIKVPAEAGTFY
jgi:hypothetical protein